MKNICLLFLFLFSSLLMAQVGVNTTNPKTALHAMNKSGEELGLTVPTVSSTENSTTTDGSPVPNGTLVYDTSRQALCVKLENRWNCITSTGVTPVVTAPNNSDLYQQAYIKAPHGYSDDFGIRVVLSGDGNTLAVSDNDYSNATGINANPSDNSAQNAGAVYIFTRTGNTWTHQAYIKASNTDANDYFGNSLSLSDDGNTLAVGAYNESSNATGINGNRTDNSAQGAGAVYVFSRSGNTWRQRAYIKASNTDAEDYFGYSVALSDDGNTLAVGARYEDSNATGINGNQTDNSAESAGAVYVFSRTGYNWTQQAYIKASNADADDDFGFRLALSADGNTLAVAAPYEDSNATGINANPSDNSAQKAGAVYIFTRTGTSWTQQAYVKASNTDAEDKFGWDVELSDDGNTLAVGASFEDSNATGINSNQSDNSLSRAGAVYVFSRTGTFWTQQAYIKASNTGREDLFGNKLALNGNGNLLAAAAYWEDSNATGINGDQTNNNAPNAGAVYLFSRTGNAWTQQEYIKGSNTEIFDYFGFSISLSTDGNTLAVGASGEDSNATGVNGDESNNFSENTGAAYVFEMP